MKTIQQLEESFPSLHIKQYGGSFPYQATGIYKNYDFLFTFRGSSAQLLVNKVLTDEQMLQPALWSSSQENITHGITNGMLTYDSFMNVFEQLLTEIDLKIVKLSFVEVFTLWLKRLNEQESNFAQLHDMYSDEYICDITMSVTTQVFLFNYLATQTNEYEKIMRKFINVLSVHEQKYGTDSAEEEKIRRIETVFENFLKNFD